jgi:hypothetical protein
MTATETTVTITVPHFKSARLIRVIECVTVEGDGTPTSPARQVTTYTDLDGNVLAIHDPISERART